MYVSLAVLVTLSRNFQQWYDLLIHSLPVAVLSQDTYLVWFEPIKDRLRTDLRHNNTGKYILFL